MTSNSSQRTVLRSKVCEPKQARFYAAKATLQWATSGSLDRRAMAVSLGMAAWQGFHAVEGPTVKWTVE